MKYFRLFFLSVLVSTMAACSSDDDSTSNNNDNNDNNEENPITSIVGTWTLVELDLSINSSTTSPLGDVTTSSSEGEGSNYNTTVTFLENPNLSTTKGTYSLDLTTDYGGGQIINQTFDDLNLINLVGEWELNEEQLIINTPLNNTLNATITELTEHSLSYNSVLEETFLDTNNNTVVNIINQTFIYSR